MYSFEWQSVSGSIFFDKKKGPVIADQAFSIKQIPNSLEFRYEYFINYVNNTVCS
jgi:hypothetical protein